MTIFLAVIITLMFIAIGLNLYFTMKILGILIQMIEFVTKHVQIREPANPFDERNDVQ